MSHADRLFHTVSELDYGSDESFLTWILCILTTTFVVTSKDSHSSNGNAEFVKRERDLREPVGTNCEKVKVNIQNICRVITPLATQPFY